MIIGLSGYGRSGKDTVADYLVEHHGFRRIAFADALREMAEKLNPIIDVSMIWCEHDALGNIIDYEYRVRRYNDILDQIGYHEGKNIPEFREFLQRLGTEAVRGVIGDSTWVDLAVRRMRADPGNWVVTDARFPNEANAVRSADGVMIRINRTGFGPANDHPSETSLDDYEFEPLLVLDNDGTLEEFYALIEDKIKLLKGSYQF